MSRVSQLFLFAICCFPVTAALAEEVRDSAKQEWAKVRELSAPEANQAAAADGQFVYAIDNTLIAKYDRESGKKAAVSNGPAKHLNSGFIYEGKLYCAHSNYPRLPEQSEIKVLDPESMQLSTFKDFGSFGGSLTWAVVENDHWWCNFARYGKDNASTFLVEFDRDWRELSRYTYPPEVVRKLKAHSVSGGIWRSNALLVTGHDDRALYELQLPETGNVLKYVAMHDAPFTGQGIAVDPKTGGLVGIDRGQKKLVFAECVESKTAVPPLSLKQ
jgi:hypothetical protein